MSLINEIRQQSHILSALIQNQYPAIQKIADELAGRFDYIFLTARGSSDNAGRYSKYLFGTHNQIPVALAAPSLFSVYQQPPNLKRALVIAVSQSGRSPDIVAVVEEAKRQGVSSLTITNQVDSPLAQAAEYVIDIGAGEERAVAATKSYTAELTAIALLSAAFNRQQAAYRELMQLPAQVQAVLSSGENFLPDMVQRYRYMQHCVILGRGYNYATAYEWALKLKEMAYLIAEPYSPADFLHGPIAIVEPGFPVLAVMPGDAVFPEMLQQVEHMRRERGVEVLMLTNQPMEQRPDFQVFPLPQDLPGWLSPILSIVPAQLFAYYLTQLKGYNTEAPRGLTKVTETT